MQQTYMFHLYKPISIITDMHAIKMKELKVTQVKLTHTQKKQGTNPPQNKQKTPTFQPQVVLVGETFIYSFFVLPSAK